MKPQDPTPALFISRSGASAIGLRLMAKLPNELQDFTVSDQVRKGPEVGHHLKLFFRNPGMNPILLSNENLERLLDQSKEGTKKSGP